MYQPSRELEQQGIQALLKRIVVSQNVLYPCMFAQCCTLACDGPLPVCHIPTHPSSPRSESPLLLAPADLNVFRSPHRPFLQNVLHSGFKVNKMRPSQHQEGELDSKGKPFLILK